MNATGTPDILSLARFSRDISKANDDLLTASTELATGQKTDPVKASGGDPARLYAIDRDLSRADSRSIALTLSQARAETTQSALGKIGAFTSEIGVDLAAAAERGDIGAADKRAIGARDAFEAIVAALNTRVGERHLFAGADLGGAAVANADAIIGELETRVAGSTDAADVIASVEAYFFTDPTGFETTGYIGSTNDAPETELSQGRNLSFALKADDDAFKRALSSLALAVISAEGLAPSLSTEDRLGVYAASANQGLSAASKVVEKQAQLGDAEARIEEAITATEAERSFLQAGRNAIFSKDPFEAATEFTAFETRLQSVFAVTSRLSSLSLTNFLR